MSWPEQQQRILAGRDDITMAQLYEAFRLQRLGLTYTEIAQRLSVSRAALIQHLYTERVWL